MHIRHWLTAAALAAGVGGLIVPALAQTQGMNGGGGVGQGMMSRAGMMGGMMGGGMMSGGGMMGGGCAGMMQSMNGGGRPNSQWHSHPPATRSMPN